MFGAIARAVTVPSRIRLLAGLTPLRRLSDRPLQPPDAAADADPEPPAAPPPPSPPQPSAEARRERQFEDFLRDVIVRQSAPDWLPFIPGSSYWVPPIDMKSVKEIPAGPMNVMRLLHGLHALSSRPADGQGEGENDSEEDNNSDSDGLDSELEQD